MLRKSLILVFIVWCLTVQLQANFDIQSPIKVPVLARAAWLASLTPKWHMFTNPLKYKWHFSIWAVMPDRTQLYLPLYPDPPRSFWQEHFTDFREDKFELNLYQAPWQLKIVAQHFCQRLAAQGTAPEEIRVVLVWQMMLPPGEARETYFAPQAQQDIETIKCGEMEILQ